MKQGKQIWLTANPKVLISRFIILTVGPHLYKKNIQREVYVSGFTSDVNKQSERKCIVKPCPQLQYNTILSQISSITHHDLAYTCIVSTFIRSQLCFDSVVTLYHMHPFYYITQ